VKANLRPWHLFPTFRAHSAGKALALLIAFTYIRIGVGVFSPFFTFLTMVMVWLQTDLGLLVFTRNEPQISTGAEPLSSLVSIIEALPSYEG
jgi:hypothetical protein